MTAAQKTHAQPSTSTSSTSSPLPSLVTVLRAFSEEQLDAHARRLNVPIESAKRLEPAEQVARYLVTVSGLRERGRLGAESFELLQRIAACGGRLMVSALPGPVDQLLARGIVYAAKRKTGVELILPAAFYLMTKPWEGEDPRSLRALLSQTSVECHALIASYYLGRTATPPYALALETAWAALSDPSRLQAEIDSLTPNEMRVLGLLEKEGGEVMTEELMDLEREPLRVRTSSGASQTRRGISYVLERKGLLIPLSPNRHVIPTEVSRIIGESSRQARSATRAALLASMQSEDYEPRRARFAENPSALAMALAIAVRDGQSDLKPGVGTPKSLINRLSARFGMDANKIAMLVALSRATGLWDASAQNSYAVPGSLSLQAVTELMFRTWHRGGAWDEGRVEGEVLRVQAESRDLSPVGSLRDMLLGGLAELGDDRWVPWEGIRDYLASDERMPGLGRLFRRWSERVSIAAVDPIDVAYKILTESLPALGVIDIGTEGSLEAEDGASRSFRLTAQGRALLHTGLGLKGREPKPIKPTNSTFTDERVLRVGSNALVAQVLALAQFVELGTIDTNLEVNFEAIALSRAITAGFESDVIRSRIEALAPLTRTLNQSLARLGTVVGKAAWTEAAGFLWLEEDSTRSLLLSKKSIAELFITPSPPGGLLVAQGVELERLVRRARGLGVEITQDGSALRALPARTSARARRSLQNDRD
jgi:hypothetical protein